MAPLSFSIVDAGSGSVRSDGLVAGVVDRPARQPGGPVAVYAYRGPLGPAFEGYDRPDRTVIWGPQVPTAELAIGAPETEPATVVTRRLRAGIAGRIGDQPATIRAAAEGSGRLRRLDVSVGGRDHALVASGVLTRVGLHRADHTLVVAYTVRGRRPHQLVVEPTGTEVVLALFLTRFVSQLAHRG